jgi:predicted membrane channel-forming protein YqfA (hemolysin III family)
MRINNIISFLGFIILIAATYCPILHPFHLITWDVYDGNKPYGIIILLVAVIGMLGTVFNQVKIIRLAAWLSLALVILFYLAALLKVYISFSFIPFRSFDNFLSKQIKFKWGWYLLFGGPLLALAGRFLEKNDSFK